MSASMGQIYAGQPKSTHASLTEFQRDFNLLLITPSGNLPLFLRTLEKVKIFRSILDAKPQDFVAQFQHMGLQDKQEMARAVQLFTEFCSLYKIEVRW